MSESETVVAKGRRSLPAAIACLALLALPVAGCGGDDEDQNGETKAPAAAAKKSVTVNIASFKFVEDPVRVKAGGTVTWVNQDDAPHTAETEDGVKDGFDTRRLDLGEKSRIDFAKPGKFQYFCVYHRFMTGTVEVVE